jgi:N-acetyltransferase
MFRWRYRTLGQNGVMTLDLNGYFDRINHLGPAQPNLDVLQDLVTAHTRTIPFENLDPLMGVPVDDLSPGALATRGPSRVSICKRVVGTSQNHPSSFFVERAETTYAPQGASCRLTCALAEIEINSAAVGFGIRA